MGERTNADQRARLDYVLRTTGPDEPVFDGYSGFGVFRPHAYRYWFLHEEMQAMLTDEEKGAAVVRALERAQPPVVVVDGWVKTLPAVVREHVASRYDDTEFPDIKRLRPTAAAATGARAGSGS